jgi:hypothetical protein
MLHLLSPTARKARKPTITAIALYAKIEGWDFENAMWIIYPIRTNPSSGF